MKLNVEIEGSGPTIVCLPGLGWDNACYDFLGSELKNEFTLIKVDFPGTGKSFARGPGYSLLDLAYDVKESIDELGHHQFHLVGISMGGFVAQEFIREFPKQVMSLGLLCSSGAGEDFIDLPRLEDDDFIKLKEMGVDGNRLIVHRTTHPSLESSNPKLFEKIVSLRWDHNAPVTTSITQNNAAKKFLTKNYNYREIQSPTFICHGNEDRFVDPKNADNMAKKVNGATVHFIEKSDHLFFLEKPKEISKLYKSFLRGIK